MEIPLWLLHLNYYYYYFESICDELGVRKLYLDWLKVVPKRILHKKSLQLLVVCSIRFICKHLLSEL